MKKLILAIMLFISIQSIAQKTNIYIVRKVGDTHIVYTWNNNYDYNRTYYYYDYSRSVYYEVQPQHICYVDYDEFQKIFNQMKTQWHEEMKKQQPINKQMTTVEKELLKKQQEKARKRLMKNN